MIVKLEIYLNLPQEMLDDFPGNHLTQLLFDEYVNYATCAHAEDASYWCSKASKETGDLKESSQRIQDIHHNWMGICKNAKWDHKMVDDKVCLEVELDIVNNSGAVQFSEFFTKELLAEAIFDSYTNYVTCYHLRESLKWLAKASKSKDKQDELIFENHQQWGDICRKVDYDILIDGKTIRDLD